MVTTRSQFAAGGLLMLAAWLAALGTPSAAQAQQVTASRVKNSIWYSTYTAANGQRVQATITLRGSRGAYNTNFGTGRLYNIEYFFDTAGTGSYPWAGLIQGEWSFQGASGTFRFNASSNTLRFSGDWDYGDGQGRGGTWNGRFARLIEENNGTINQPGPSSGTVTYGSWKRTERGNYYRICYFPRGGYQYVILFPQKPEWVYWYNPTSNVYWCCCPTIRHPRYGEAIADGGDLFLMATTKAGDIEDTEFPDDSGPNFKSGATAKDKDGSTVNLGCPPTDLPSGI